MLKPLIRIIPNLSGNVKISCALSNFEKSDDNVFECCTRYAKLVPISTVLAEKYYELNLLNSTYEFDMKKYYKMYSSIFYDTQFLYPHDIYGDGDITEELNNRDKDFEYGVKRVSYTKNGGSQFSFFAPIWIDNKNDLPDYFLMHINIGNSINNIEKTIKININNTRNSSKYNYLSVYLNRYANKIDNNVIFCLPLTNQATYYGIDVERGGFVKKIDNIIGKNYRFQSSINKFDLNITEGFRRNKLCIKQILPLSFMFSLEDILTKYEMKKYSNAKINVYGEYWKDNKKVKFYDFNIDYTSLKQQSWLVKNGKFEIQDTKRNIMNIEFPSLMEASYQGYEHFNKIQKEAVRWKLRYSKDEYPYITNFSPAFSIAQKSSFKYREYPTPFIPISIYNDINNNIISPLYNSTFYKKNKKTLNKYVSILQNNASNWFNTIDNIETFEKRIVYNLNDLNSNVVWYKEINNDDINNYIPIRYKQNIANLDPSLFANIVPDYPFEGSYYVECSPEDISDMNSVLNPKNEDGSDNPNYDETAKYTLFEKKTIFDDKSYWGEVDNNKVYFKGILYDLTKIYDKYPNLGKIDKFGVFINPNIQLISKNKLNNIKAAQFTILSDKKYITNYNAVQSTHLKGLLSGEEEYSPIYMSEASIGKRTNEVSHDSLFFENESIDKDGQFLDLTKIGYDVYDLNKYYEVKELIRKYPEVETMLMHQSDNKIINGYYFIPVYRLSQISFDGTSLWFENDHIDEEKWIRNKLFFNLRDNHNKTKYDKEAFSDIIPRCGNGRLECPLFIESQFMSAYSLKQLVDNEAEISQNCSHYMFNPILVDQNDTYAVNIFSETKCVDMNYGHSFLNTGNHVLNYGDYFFVDKLVEDNDFIYLDPYNMKNVMEEDWNDEWLNDPLYCGWFLAKFLNKTHLNIFVDELHKNSNAESETYKGIELIRIQRRILFNDYENEKIYIKDISFPILDFYKNDYGEYLTDLDYKDIVRKMLRDLIYDKETNTWHFSNEYISSHDIKSLLKYTDDDPDLPQYDFVLVYSKIFVKVNKAIWEKININNYDKYIDLYLYSLSKEVDYPETLKYQCSYDLELLNSCFDVKYTLKPLFTNVFIRNQQASTIYEEYNQSKITYASFGDEEFYRYESDNTPLMVDLHNYDIKHNLIYGPETNGERIAYYSYSYLNNLSNSYDPYTVNEAYNYMNGLDHYAYGVTYLPTFNMIDKCSANIKLANVTEQELEYYSASSYNYISQETVQYISYYSSYEYSRIDFNTFDDDLCVRTGEHSEEEQGGVIVHQFSYDVIEDTPKTYYDLHSRYITTNVGLDDLGIYDEFGISTYTMAYSYTTYYSYLAQTIEPFTTDDGLITYNAISYKTTSDYVTNIGYCTYGLIYIDAKYNNTNSSLNLIDDHYNDKKYFVKVNGRDIYSYDFSIKRDFAELVPFMKFDLFNTLSTYGNYVVTPFVNTINAYNFPMKISNNNSYDIITNKRPLCSITLERYFDAITPLITEIDNIPNTYMIKLENSDKHSLVNPENNESVLYNENVNIYNTNGTRLYRDKQNYERVFQIEEKHFNDNNHINLESQIKINVGKNLTYEEMIKAETDENVIKIFSEHIRKTGSFDNNEILFLYKKYDISYDSYSTGIDYNKLCKVYSLTIIFNLI